jgi:hypothetical protein
MALPQSCCMPGIPCDVIIDGRAAITAMASIAARAQRMEEMMRRVTAG